MTQYSPAYGKDVAKRGNSWYAKGIRTVVETPENVGKMVVIDVETGEYEVDDLGLEASHYLHVKRPGALLYGIRTGYKVAETLGGIMERSEA